MKLLNLENGLFSDEERQTKFAGLFARALPLLFQCRTEVGAAEALSSKAMPEWMLTKASVELLLRETRHVVG